MILEKRNQAARMRRFLFDRAGLAAIEFALLLPVLTVGVVAISDTANIGIAASNMQSAARASIQYAINGGTNLTEAETLGKQAWSDAPKNGTISVTKACYCGSSGGTCGELCSDGTVPTTYVTAVTSATIGGSLIAIDKSVTESARLQ